MLSVLGFLNRLAVLNRAISLSGSAHTIYLGLQLMEFYVLIWSLLWMQMSEIVENVACQLVIKTVFNAVRFVTYGITKHALVCLMIVLTQCKLIEGEDGNVIGVLVASISIGQLMFPFMMQMHICQPMMLL